MATCIMLVWRLPTVLHAMQEEVVSYIAVSYIYKIPVGKNKVVHMNLWDSDVDSIHLSISK